MLTIYEDLASIPESQTFEINGHQVKVKDLYALNIKIAKAFTPYLSSKHLSVIWKYLDKDFYLHYADFLLSLDSFPNAAVAEHNTFSGRFETATDAVAFVKAMNAFYTEIRFGDFLEKYKPYYEEMISEVTQNLPAENFITEMEHLYGKRISHYNLYPSLTMSFSQGFAVGNADMIGNIFGSFNKPESVDDAARLDLGYHNSISLRTLCIHEFGHSFVNPAVDAAGDRNIDNQEKLFAPIKDMMAAQGYDKWKICLYEHFVRAGEIMVTRLVADDHKAAAIMDDYVTQRSFVYLPQIVEKLEYWYYHKFFTKTYEQKVSEIIAEMH